ncbi:MAG TPA: glycogen debranching N-terminal domain-containing protein [Gammaproteobacteria bacterium]|nr:glycogen debranching N-terminal domain-containing protein [Gammaproteobacteria bacterium]
MPISIVDPRIPHRYGTGLNSYHPSRRLVYQGYTVLITSPDGIFTGGGREGLYDFDTRILSQWHTTLAGQRPDYVASATLESHRWLAHLRVPRSGGQAAGPRLPQDALELVISRRVGCGMEERLIVSNHSMVPVETELTIELDADFADVQETGGSRLQQGTMEVGWDAISRALLFDYHVAHQERRLRRALRVRVVTADSEPACTGRILRFPLRLAPRGQWRGTLHYDSWVDGAWREPPPELPDSNTERDRLHARWREQRARLECVHPVLGPAFEQAAEDLFALRNFELDEGPDAWIPNAGVPTYTGLFGRDCLTAAYQGALLGPEMLRGTLARVAATQAREDSAWHDEEPGKMIHEMRRGPLAELEIIPQRAYYGTQTTPAMFVLALSEYWHWTGDTRTLQRYVEAALRTFEWAARYGDRDGDGFLEYVKRSPKGLKNHAWKDSDEAIRYPDGRLVENPIATVEEQAFHFIALSRMAEVLVALGEEVRAEELLHCARQLKRRWHAAFWVAEDGFYAMALDAEKRPVRSIGSNPGHALGVGLVPREQARIVADRLMAPELFSGWGVRTLSTQHPAYNPYGYHLGTVWPVENATFALGFKRYGLDGHLERLVTGLFSAAGHFQDLRLPEALGGHALDQSPVPTLYPMSNSPQAWSASATVQLVQTLLGLYPFAPAQTLTLVRPRLPAWLDAVTVRRVRVGDARVSIRFEREADGRAAHEVIERKGTLHIITVPPPEDVNGKTSWLDTIKEWALEHAPGRLARAARIAFGKLD